MSRLKQQILLSSGKHTALTRPVVYAQSLVVIGTFFWVPYLVYYIMKKYKKSRQKVIAMLTFLCVLIVPIKKNIWFQNLFVWDHYARYFQTKVVGIPFSKKQTVFGIIPHGIVPLTLGLSAFGELNKYFNSLSIIVASATRIVPVFSHILRLGGAVDASKPCVEAVLREGKSIGINPGGIAEMFWGYPQPGCLANIEYAVLKNRKGFVRLAIKYGTSLIPVFVFGGSKVYKRILLPKILEDFSKKFRVSILLFFGKFGLPIPLEVPMTYAVGATIETFKNLDPTPEEVDFVHNIFCKALNDTFETHKYEYGWCHKSLKIV